MGKVSNHKLVMCGILQVDYQHQQGGGHTYILNVNRSRMNLQALLCAGLMGRRVVMTGSTFNSLLQRVWLCERNNSRTLTNAATRQLLVESWAAFNDTSRSCAWHALKPHYMCTDAVQCSNAHSINASTMGYLMLWQLLHVVSADNGNNCIHLRLGQASRSTCADLHMWTFRHCEPCWFFWHLLKRCCCTTNLCVCVFSAYVTSNSSCILSFSVSFEPLLELLMSAQLQLVRPGTRRQLSSKVQAPLPSVISAAICLLSHYLSAWQQSVSCNL